MKFRLVFAAVLAFLVLAGTAQAFQWHLGYGQAKHASREFVEQLCSEDHECTGFGVGHCQRVSLSRIDCTVGIFFAESPAPGEETECNVALHWGVNRGGLVTLKRHGSLNCFRL